MIKRKRRKFKILDEEERQARREWRRSYLARPDVHLKIDIEDRNVTISYDREQHVFMEGVDWQHEVDACNCTIYPSIDRLKKDNGSWKSSGIVKVKMIAESWPHEQNLFSGDARTIEDWQEYQKSDEYRQRTMERIERLYEQFERTINFLLKDLKE